MNAIAAALVLSTLAAPQAVELPSSDDQGRAYFEKLYQDRLKIVSGYFEYQVATEVNTKSPQLEGSTRSYRLWFGKERRRVDLHELRPKDPSNALVTRYSYSDGVHRFVYSDNPIIAVDQYSDTFSKGEGERSPVTIGTKGVLNDPRLFGIIGIDFGLIHHYQLDELKAPDPVSVLKVFPSPKEKKTEIVISFPDGRSTTYTLVPSSLLPSRIVTKFATNFPEGGPAPNRRVELDSQVAAWRNSRGESFDFPRSLRIRRIMDGEIESAESVSIIKADFNIPPDPEDMTWKALRPPIGATLSIDHEIQGNSNAEARWNGEAFVLMSPKTVASEITTPTNPTASRGSWLRTASWVALCLGVVLASIFAFIKITGRR